ncbi:hypothetical protein, partial [Paraburkholderia sp. EG304]|uniref:hypothetical protein n=1 Tax=Paraburkholderia sp. EG304 TaxID=3237015 RepID=UPI00397AEE8D
MPKSPVTIPKRPVTFIRNTQLGKRIGATIRQLGYPTKNSLKAWHREYERCHDLQIGYVRSRP